MKPRLHENTSESSTLRHPVHRFPVPRRRHFLPGYRRHIVDEENQSTIP